MIENKTDFEKVTDFGNLYQAYKNLNLEKAFHAVGKSFKCRLLMAYIKSKED